MQTRSEHKPNTPDTSNPVGERLFHVLTTIKRKVQVLPNRFHCDREGYCLVCVFVNETVEC